MEDALPFGKCIGPLSHCGCSRPYRSFLSGRTYISSYVYQTAIHVSRLGSIVVHTNHQTPNSKRPLKSALPIILYLAHFPPAPSTLKPG